MCAAPRPDSVRAVKNPLSPAQVHRLHHHQHRTLQDFVLQRRNANRACLCSSPASPGAPMRTAGARYRPGLEPLEQSRQGSPPGRPRIAPPSLRPHPPPRPCVFAGRLRASTPRQHDAPASSGSASAPSEPAPLSCARRVEMTSRPNVPVICPSASSIIRSAASHPPGPLGYGRSPTSSVPISRTPTSRLPSRLASSPSLGTNHRFALLRSPGAGRLPVGLEPLLPRRLSRRTLNGGEDEISQVPGRPLRTCPALRPRRTADPRPLQDRRCSLPHFKGASTPHLPLSRLTITRPARSLCTLRSRGQPPDHATLDSGWCANLDRSGSHLRGRIDGLPSCLSVYMASSITKLRLAQIKDGLASRWPGGASAGPALAAALALVLAAGQAAACARRGRAGLGGG